MHRLGLLTRRHGVATVRALTASALLTTAYALAEARAYTLRRVRLEIPNHHGESDLPDVRVLHLSDLHLVNRDKDRARWVAGLADLRPDLVVVTGDLRGGLHVDDIVLSALGDLLAVPGLYVHGSNDYFAPTANNPAKYFRGPTKLRPHRPPIDHTTLDRKLDEAGWLSLDNRSAELRVRGWLIAARGTDDPHIRRDKYEEVAGPFDPAADLRLAVTHAPYAKVLDAMAADEADLIFAGHTHGGQICLPWFGALVTNCDLPRSQVKGLSTWKSSALHVSAGLGTNPYTPIRIACRPEATLLTLVKAPA